MRLRAATPADAEAIWDMLAPVFRAGDTYAIAPNISRDEALAYWGAAHVFVAEDDVPRGTYFIRPNQQGGGDHVCNAGFITAKGSEGRGVARAMLADALVRARALGFEAMQFNFVLASNTRALQTWARAGFVEIGRIPRAFRHPEAGYVDALILHKFLD